MKKILGLDLGVASIGWALIGTNEHSPERILGMGTRIIPLSPDDANEFSTGNAISKNQKRTTRRTQRKGNDRYQLRRKNLTFFLRKYHMTPSEDLIKLEKLSLWELRAKAAQEKITLQELGRVFYHLNQKRGYKSSKSDLNEDKKQREYVEAISKRQKLIKELGLTIGQYFYRQLTNDRHYRTKEQVFPRKSYVEEFDLIWAQQSRHYPDVLTEINRTIVRDEIIYYQRNLKSCKHLVSVCDFEAREYKNLENKTVLNGPKVAPRSSPLFQVCKIWESTNNLILKNRKGEDFDITLEQKQSIFHHLDTHEKLTLTDLYQILGIKKSDGWWGGKAIGKGLQGNTTRQKLSKILEGTAYEHLLRFDLKYTDRVDPQTGEIIKQISPEFEKEPLYRLWHLIYSVNERSDLSSALKSIGIEDENLLNELLKLDFVNQGFGNKSSKAMRKILPFLQNGLKYSEACEAAGFRHSESLTSAENQARELLSRLPLLKKNELRQPVVEKVLNQMINLVNALLERYGQIDEIRIELARELKQSKDERNATDKNIRQNEKENNLFAKRIFEEYGLTPTRSRIKKYKMWNEAGQICFYCGQPVNVKEFLNGFDVEVEHIVPKSLLFDDSFSNKVCACRKCNAEKGNRTAFDYMKSKPAKEFEDYLLRVEEYHKSGKISKTKKERLLTPKEKIPLDFIDRQLRETQYISRKAKEILSQVCRNVWATSGSVTDFIRHTWGWDEVLHDLQLEKYKNNGGTEEKVFIHLDQQHDVERIKDWSKRMDHRHHAVDALVIACTRQGFIQRLNNLNTERDAMFKELKHQNGDYQVKFSLLEQWLKEQPHFSKSQVQDKAAEILVSFKSGKRVACWGKRVKQVNGKKIVLQKQIVVPRGALHEESVYGKIKTLERKPVKKLFEDPQLIYKPTIRRLVEDRLAENAGDLKKALASLAKNPIMLRNEVPLEFASCYKEEYVLKYPLQSLKAKDVNSIIDCRVREAVKQRLNQFNNNEKEAFKDIENNPVWMDERKTIPIKTVRCFTGLSAVEPVKKNEEGEAIGFVKTGNNHHIAIYSDKEGKKHEHCVTFWNAVERKKYRLPVVIKNPSDVWDLILEKNLPENFLSSLPLPDWKYELSLQQNEMFILGMSPEEFNSAVEAKDYCKFSNYLYRVQKIGACDYTFRFHLETSLKDTPEAKKMKLFYRIQSFSSFFDLAPQSVRINNLGEILPSTGEVLFRKEADSKQEA